MRDIPVEVKTLLKSRSMIGENKPNYEVSIDGMGGNLNIPEEDIIFYRPNSTSAGYFSFANCKNGKIIALWSKSDGTALVQGYANDLDSFIADDSVSSTSEIFTSSAKIIGTVFNDNAGNLFLAIARTGSEAIGANKQQARIYKSPSGNGGDWDLHGIIRDSSVTEQFLVFGNNPIGAPTILDDGKWVINYPHYADSGFGNFVDSYGTAISDDNGETWTLGGRVSVHYNYSRDWQSRNLGVYGDKIWNYIISISGSGIGTFYYSENDGATWTSGGSLSDHLDFSGFAYYCSISFFSFGEYLYFFYGNNIGGKGGLYKTKTPEIITSWTKVLKLDIDGAKGSFCKIYNNRIVISVNHHILSMPLTSSRLPIKSISINRNKNMAGGLNLSINNKNGEWSPDNTINQNILFPNKEITVKQGYGEILTETFAGLIDRIEMSTFPQELRLSVRDKLKLALDQTISPQVIKYTEQTVEDIFIDLAGKAGLTVGTVETTGLTIAEKTFSWETYADCFSWLADLVGFEFGCDEEGKVYFKKDAIPSATDWILTFTDGVAQAYFPIVADSDVLKSSDGLTTYVKDTNYTIDYDTGELTSLTIPDGETLMSYVFAVYSFKEGEDIISLGYTIDDNDIYSKVIVYGKDENDEVISAYKDYVSKDYYNVLSQKVMKIDVSEVSTAEQLQAIADRAEMLMRSRVRIVRFAAVAVPWLQVGDLIQVIESSTTISELYRVTDLSTSMDSDGYTMQITCYHHSA